MPGTKRILLVDDHPIVRAGLRAALTAGTDLVVTGEASTARQALTLLEQDQPDLVVTDLAMEGPDGIHLTKAIKARWGDLPVLVVSSYDETLFAERAVLAGAGGYVMKDRAVQTLREAVFTVLQGGIYLSDSMWPRLVPAELSIDADTLDPEEAALLRAVGKGAVSGPALADRLGKPTDDVEATRGRVMRKLGVTAPVQLILLANRWCATLG